MQPLGDAMYHLQLLARMGQALEVDLIQAFEAGDLSAEDWAAMVQSCRGCTMPEDCQHWLEVRERQADGRKDALPSVGCCNAAQLLALRQSNI